MNKIPDYEGTVGESRNSQCGLCGGDVTEVILNTGVPGTNPVSVYKCFECDKFGAPDEFGTIDSDDDDDDDGGLPPLEPA